MDLYDERAARLYELEHREFDADFDLYLSYARSKGGPILELGCGTGRVLLPLLKRGYHVAGVDTSEAMLALAREKLAEYPESRLSLVCTRLQDLDGIRDETYALAYCALNTWSHLHDAADALRALNAVRRVLLPAGLLIIDLQDAEYRQPSRGEMVLAGVFEKLNGTVVKTVAVSTDAATGVDEAVVVWDETAGTSLVRTVRRTLMRPYRRGEMEQLLARASFEIEDVFGSWALDEYSTQGDRLIFVASRL